MPRDIMELNSRKIRYTFIIAYTLILCNILDFTMCIRTTANYMDTDRNPNCSTDISAGEQKEALKIPFEENCEIYTYNFESSNERSIVSIASAVEKPYETIGGNNESRINVFFYERKRRMKTWRLTYENATEKQIYLSRTASLKVEISIKGNWSEYRMNFYYMEYNFVLDPNSKNCSDEKGSITSLDIPELGRYRPNSVSVYNLLKSEGTNGSSFEITLHYLDIDVAVGEYMLIGAGEEVFQGPPPLFIASEKNEAKYVVDDENAYVVFISGPTRFPHRGFSISYEQQATKIVNPKEDDFGKNDDTLQSMPICFYNVSAALEEFKETDKEKRFLEFRKEFANVAINYAKNHTMSAASYLSKSHIELFRLSGIVKFKREEDGEDGEALYVMLKVRGREKGEAAFAREDLRKIIERYDSQSNRIYGYKIGKCPSEYLHPKVWDIVIYSSLPAAFCLCLVMWAWKRNVYQECCFQSQHKLTEKISAQLQQGKKKQDENETRVKSNVYSPEPGSITVPKVQVYTTTGRRYTLSQKNSFSVDVEEDFTDYERPSSLNKVQDPSPTANNECDHHLETVSPIREEAMKQETEHLYDSVKSVDTLRHASQTTETKL